MSNTKAIKKRIGSVKNTKKITKSVQMIAAVKMQKTSAMTKKTKAYSEKFTELLNKFYFGTEEYNFTHPLLEKREVVRNVLLVVVAGNRGLCGSYNANVLNVAKNYYNEKLRPIPAGVSVLAIGKKAALLAKRLGLELIGIYDDISENPSYEDTLPISNQIIESFENKQFDKVVFITTSFVSSFVQNVTIETLLPVVEHSFGDDNRSKNDYEYDHILFEPASQELFDVFVPKIITNRVYQAILEAATSEHSSRMIAMKNANDNANNLVNDLTIQYNKTRQAAITQEMAEIISGMDTIIE
jgi:F-type H+-transporting ATPase subunit gamma